MNLYQRLHIDHKNPKLLRQQIREQIAWLIVDGVIKVGAKLPSIHVLSEQLGVNLHTIRHAYHLLESDGLVVSRQGRGTKVIDFNLSDLVKSAEDRRNHTIGIILPSWSNPFYHRFLQGVESTEEAEQALFFHCLTNDNPLKAWREIARLIVKGIDGLLIVSHDIDTIIDPQKDCERLAGIPYVSIDVPGAIEYSIQIDLYSAGYQATQYLLEQGHVRIGLITFYKDAENVNLINQGYTDALKDAGITGDPDLYCKVNGFNITAGKEGMQYFMKLDDPPSAVFAITDLMAIGAMKIAKESAIKIPRDLSVVGFNNIPMGEMVEPALTTISAPSEVLGQEAMKMLGQLINGTTPAEREVILPVSLIIRGSTDRFHKK